MKLDLENITDAIDQIDIDMDELNWRKVFISVDEISDSLSN